MQGFIIRRSAALLLILLCASPAGARQKKAAASKAEEEIKNLEYAMAGYMMHGDADAYGAHLSDDYVLINAAGSVVTKPQILAALKAGASADSLIPSNLSVRVYGETAVLNGHLTWKGLVNGQKIELESLFTKIFVRRKGQWLMVNNQGTALPPRQIAK